MHAGFSWRVYDRRKRRVRQAKRGRTLQPNGRLDNRAAAISQLKLKADWIQQWIGDKACIAIRRWSERQRLGFGGGEEQVRICGQRRGGRFGFGIGRGSCGYVLVELRQGQGGRCHVR
jgi:hypothetical protein